MTVDKPKHERLDITGSINVKDLKVIKGKNVSLGGICVIIENETDINEVIEVEFNLPGNLNKFSAQAKVVWQEKSDKGYNTGLKFTNIRVIK